MLAMMDLLFPTHNYSGLGFAKANLSEIIT